MKQISENEIEVKGVKICFETSIKKVIEYDKFFIVLIRERMEMPNNIIAYDYFGNEIWKVNDIVRAKIPREYYDMEKVTGCLFYKIGTCHNWKALLWCDVE